MIVSVGLISGLPRGRQGGGAAEVVGRVVVSVVSVGLVGDLLRGWQDGGAVLVGDRVAECQLFQLGQLLVS